MTITKTVADNIVTIFEVAFNWSGVTDGDPGNSNIITRKSLPGGVGQWITKKGKRGILVFDEEIQEEFINDIHITRVSVCKILIKGQGSDMVDAKQLMDYTKQMLNYYNQNIVALNTLLSNTTFTAIRYTDTLPTGPGFSKGANIYEYFAEFYELAIAIPTATAP